MLSTRSSNEGLTPSAASNIQSDCMSVRRLCGIRSMSYPRHLDHMLYCRHSLWRRVVHTGARRQAHPISRAS